MLSGKNHKDRTMDLCVCVFWGWGNMKGRLESIFS